VTTTIGAANAALAFDRGRLTAARELRALTQAALARDAAVTPAAVSQYENGHARPSPQTLARLAAALAVPVEYLARPPGVPADAPPAYFRSLRKAAPAQRRRAAALASLLHELALALDQHVALPPRDLPPPRSAAGDDDIEQAAADARAHFGLDPAAPVPDVVRELERHGAVAARFRLQAEGIDAFSVPYAQRPVVVLGSDKDHRDRSRFDAAHELGHLVLHGPEDAGTKRAEDQAHRFASAFLLPADAVRGDLPVRADWRLLVDLKQHWQVSVAALLRRAKDLGRMSPEAYVQANKTISARGWRVDEPGPLGPPEQPVVIAEALRVAAGLGVSLEDLAASRGLPLHDLRAVLPAVDTRPAVRI
jgi:Zn-dependent peptidase ImmA (M78 family)/transcriptional regulator with XRE-family HTH domain